MTQPEIKTAQAFHIPSPASARRKAEGRSISAILAIWLSGAALGLFSVEFLSFNQDFLPPREMNPRAALGAAMLVAPLILAGIWGAWSFLLTRMTGLSRREALHLDAPTYLPLLLLGCAPLIHQLRHTPVTGNHAAVVTLITLTVCGVTGWKALSEGPYVRAQWRALLSSRAWVIGAVILFFLATSGLVMARYAAHNFWGVDLAQFDQAMWNTWRGHPLAFTQYGGLPETLLTDHFEPIMLLVAPLYLIWPDPRALLILQAGALAVGGWLVYRLALSYLTVPFVAVCAALAYLVHPGVINAALAAGGSFRPDALTVPLFLGVLLALEHRRWVAALILAVLAMACKEYIALVVIPLGFYVIYRYRRPGLGLLFSALGAIWFFGVMFVIMPALRGGSGSIHYALNFGQMGGEAGMGGIAWTLLRDPLAVLGLAATQPDVLAIFFGLTLTGLPADLPRCAGAGWLADPRDVCIGRRARSVRVPSLTGLALLLRGGAGGGGEPVNLDRTPNPPANRAASHDLGRRAVERKSGGGVLLVHRAARLQFLEHATAL